MRGRAAALVSASPGCVVARRAAVAADAVPFRRVRDGGQVPVDPALHHRRVDQVSVGSLEQKLADQGVAFLLLVLQLLWRGSAVSCCGGVTIVLNVEMFEMG